MNRQRLSRLWVLTVLALVPVVQGCTGPFWVSGGPIIGQVIEDRSKQPIADAFVLVEWKGSAAYSTTVCIHVASTTTDADGRYLIPVWNKKHGFGNASDQRVYITTYKAGYRRVGTYINNPELEALTPDTRPPEQRLQYLLRASPGCNPKDGSEKSRIPLLRAVYEEAKSLATTKEDEKVLDFILYDLEIIELGFEEAEKRHLKR